VEREYTGWPDRLVLIGKDGRVVYRSEPGPFGFHPAELEQAIRSLYL
jgi:type I thyroxine 5'-deiodinase